MKRKALAVLFWLSPIAAITALILAFCIQEFIGFFIWIVLLFIYPICFLSLSSFHLTRKSFFQKGIYATLTTSIVMNGCMFYTAMFITCYYSLFEAYIDQWSSIFMLVFTSIALFLFALIHFVRLKLIPYYKEKHKLKES
jgi:hypothetical protein